MQDGRSIDKLFREARDNAGFQYICTLLRIEGLTADEPDRVTAVFDFLQSVKRDFKHGTIGDMEQVFNRLIGERDLYCLIANLIGNALSEGYKFNPLANTEHRDTHIIDALIEKTGTYIEKNPEFCSVLYAAFSEKARSVYRGMGVFASAEEYAENTKPIVDFLFEVLKRYSRILRAWTKESPPPFFPMSQSFDVNEILVDSERGLYGVQVHHSTGSISSFKRYPDSTDGIGFFPNPATGEIILTNVGFAERPQQHWVVNGRPLYEIGTPGRYNVVGEWKPLLYPGDPGPIQRRAMELTNEEKDKRVAGCLFYIMATTHHAIEFVAKTDFDIPMDAFHATMGDMRIQLHKIDLPGDNTPYINERIYDGTLYIKQIDVEAIKRALDAINIFFNRLAFRADVRVEWFQKYRIYGSGGSKKILSDKEFKELGEYMLALSGDDVSRIDAAVSWYNTGKVSANDFSKFFNFYVAIESLAIPLVENEMDASGKFGIEQVTKAEKKQRVAACIQALHHAKYTTDPAGFVLAAYSECIQSLRAKTELALKKVFGNDHEYPRLFFDGTNGRSIYKLRNDLVHGNFNHIDREHAQQVKDKLPLLENIAHAFIMRISLGPDRIYKTFDRHSLGLDMSDPRHTLVANSLQALPRQDWRIRGEWLS